MSNSWHRFEGGSMEEFERFLLDGRPGIPIRLVLHGNEWGPSACALLAVMSGDLDLRFVSFSGTRIGDAGVEVLAGSGALGTVRVLALERSGLTDKSLALLGSCPDLGALRDLYLCNRVGVETGMLNSFSDAGGVALAASAQLAGLETLDLWETGIGDATLDALLVSPGLPALSSLTVWATRVTREGVTRVRSFNFDRWQSTHEENASHDVL